MTIYRLVKAEYAETAFRGSRGRGRWHRQGIPMVYAADQPATALLETLVHAGRASLVEAPYVLFEITLTGDHLLRLPDSDLPDDWQDWPWPSSTQEIGSYWFVSEESVALEVPSAVIPQHSNYLLNPQHTDFSEIPIVGPEEFPTGPQLITKKNRSIP